MRPNGYYTLASEHRTHKSVAQFVKGFWYLIGETIPISDAELFDRGWYVDDTSLLDHLFVDGEFEPSNITENHIDRLSSILAYIILRFQDLPDVSADVSDMSVSDGNLIVQRMDDRGFYYSENIPLGDFFDENVYLYDFLEDRRKIREQKRQEEIAKAVTQTIEDREYKEYQRLKEKFEKV